MARVLVARLPWGTLWEKATNRQLSVPLSGTGASINTTVYSAATGSGTVSSFVTDANGDLPGWVDEGTYTLTVNGVSTQVEAVSGVAGLGQVINVAQQAGATNADKLTAAIAALPTTGAHLHIPRGQYTGAWTITSKTHLTITGEGSSTVIHNTTASPADALTLTGCDELTIRDVRVQGTAGTRDGLHLENCQRARVERVFCLGTGRHGIYAQRCFGIVVDQGAGGPDTASPYPAGVVAQQSGLVLTWDGADVSSGCNQFHIKGGAYAVGQTQDWAIQIIRAEGGTVDGPIISSSKGGKYLEFCDNIIINGYYGERNPSDVAYEAGTASTTAGSTAVTGAGTAWNTLDGEGNKNAMPGKYLVIGTKWARIASVQSDTALTLAANWPGSTASGQTYRMVGVDLHLKGCNGCRTNWGRGGGAVLLEDSSDNEIDLLTDSMYVDAGSNYNRGNIRTNRAGAGTGRLVVSASSTGNQLRQFSHNTGVVVQPAPRLQSYLAAARPAAADCTGVLIYVSDAAAGSKIQYSDGSAWVAAG